METIYLDHNATTRPADSVAAAMDEANRGLWANPSSVHRLGQQARQRVELARESVAKLIGGKPRALTFTSGGTESIKLALEGVVGGMCGGGGDGGEKVRLLTTRVEHAAVREQAERMREDGAEVGWLCLDEAGRVLVDELVGLLNDEQAAGCVTILSVQWANNETGAVQPMGAIAEAVAAARAAGRRVIWHVDGTQWVGKMPTDVAAGGYDLLTFAGHKFHGPKGVGVLWARRGVRLRAVQVGGPQEREKRGGTENTVGLIGMGAAAEAASAWLVDPAERDRLAGERDRFERRLIEGAKEVGVAARVNGGAVERLWNTSNVAFRGLGAEAILVGLSERGVCASAGAACSSGSLEPSPVLLAMGMEAAWAHGSVRFSLSRETTAAELDAAAGAAVEVVGGLGRLMPMGQTGGS